MWTLSAGPHLETLKHIMLQNQNTWLQNIAIFQQDRAFCHWASEVHDILYTTSDKKLSGRGTPTLWYLNPPGSYNFVQGQVNSTDCSQQMTTFTVLT